ncbi:MAG: ECF transporter S component [Treponema sp.]|jgi:uncharacterized membrane protein|nr:ECF transporter S component [Treponema sp.]
MNTKLRKISTAGVLSALIILLGITNLGMIPCSPTVSVTLLHVPVIVGTIIEGPIVGLITALVFGLYSLIRAAISPAGALDPFFVNPLVSILPRLLIAIVTWGVYSGLSKIKEMPKIVRYIVSAILGALIAAFVYTILKPVEILPNTLAASVSAFIGSLIAIFFALDDKKSIIAVSAFFGSMANTVFVLSSLVFFSNGMLTKQVAILVSTTNGILEAVASIVFVTAIIVVWLGYSNRKSSRLSEIKDDA